MLHTHTYTHTHISGVFRDSMPAFKRIRDARISETVVEMNRLVIRMEKVSHCGRQETSGSSDGLLHVVSLRQAGDLR